VGLRSPGQEERIDQRSGVESSGRDSSQPPSSSPSSIAAIETKPLLARSSSRRPLLLRAGQSRYHSPLARDVEVDDLALVVDHGSLVGGWKKEEKNEKKEKEERKKK